MFVFAFILTENCTQSRVWDNLVYPTRIERGHFVVGNSVRCRRGKLAHRFVAFLAHWNYSDYSLSFSF